MGVPVTASIETNSDFQLGLIGCGNMAYALAKGLVDQGWQPSRLCASDPDAKQRARFSDLKITTFENNAETASAARHLLLAIKPQVMPEVLSPLADFVNHEMLVLSVAAAVSIQQIRTYLAVPTLPVIRVMPNTPALVGYGASALYGDGITQAQHDFATEVMGATGQVLWVNEERLLAAVTAVSGSGPAYFLYLMEQMAAAGVSLGLDAADARALVLQTALGSAQLAIKTGTDVSVLRKQVTSPGGTTEAAIAALKAGHFNDLVGAAITAAHKRAHELQGD